MKAREEAARLKNALAEAQKMLRNKELIFDTILDSTLAGYWDWYIQDDYEYLSPAFKKMLGYEDHKMPNRPGSWQKIIHPDDLPCVYSAFDQHVESKGKVPFNREVRYFHKDGSIVWVYCKGQVISWSDDGKPVRMVGCHVDITELKKAQELDKHLRELGRKNDELEQFTYLVSHDLKCPLITIKGFLDMLNEDMQNRDFDAMRNSLAHINCAANRMLQILDDLLELSRIGRISGVSSSITLNEIVNKTTESLKTQLKEAKVNLEIRNGKVDLFGDVSLLIQVFQNLLGNAIKFMGVQQHPRIEIGADEGHRRTK